MRQKKVANAHKVVKAMRLYLGMTQAEAAKAVGLPLCVYANYENIPDRILNGQFCTVYRVLEMLHLDPQDLLKGNYKLNDLGYQITSRGTGPLSNIMRKSLQNRCPVTKIKNG